MPELIWPGKYNDNGQVAIAPRTPLPFQTVETVNQSAQERQMSLEAVGAGQDHAWRNRLIWGDKKYVLPSLLNEFAGKVDLIYIDPPFATGFDFKFQTQVHPSADDSGGNGSSNTQLALDYQPNLIEHVAYHDTWGGGLDTYVGWMFETLMLLRELLTDSGSIYVHCDYRTCAYTRAILDEIFGTSQFRNEVIWQGAIGDTSSKNKNFIKSHDTVFYFGKTGNPTWNDSFQDYTETSQRLYRFEDEGGRYRLAPIDNPGGGGYVYDLGLGEVMPQNGYRMPRETALEWLASGELIVQRGKVPGRKLYMGQGVRCRDVWTDISSLQGAESLRYPTQKPEALLRRIIEASSNKDDLVLDCFVGSGTTAAVAEKLGRRWIAADLSRFAISTTRKRLLDLPEVRPFHVQNLGKYERQAWLGTDVAGSEASPQQSHCNFILQLYKAQPVAGYQWLHGAKAGRMVHIGGVDAPVTLDDVQNVVEELASAIGGGPGSPISKGVDILGWDFGLEVDTEASTLARDSGMSIRLLRIPREVMDQRAVDARDIRFFELAAVTVDHSVNRRRREVALTLSNFTIPLDGVPEEVLGRVSHWDQWIDYWAVDWDYQNDTFNNQWQAYRTKQTPSLTLMARHAYDKPGVYSVVVKVIDVLGNDTTRRLRVRV